MDKDIAFSLKEARRARAEQQGEPKHFEHIDGKVYDLPVELPFTFSEALLEAKWRDAVTILLNGQAETFFAADLTNEDLQAFAEGISEVYVGESPGESSASRSRSSSTGKSSRPRSKRATTST